MALPLLDFLAGIRIDAIDLPVAPADREWKWDDQTAQAILGDAEDPDWERFRSAHLWMDSAAAKERGNPERADFRFPIAEMIDGKLTAVAAALTAARADLDDADLSVSDAFGILKRIDHYDEKIATAPKPRGDSGEWVQRYDRGVIMPAPVLRADGSLLISGVAAKPGVLVYQNADGSITRELVLPEELHRPDSLGTLGRAPVTLEHPDQEVTPHNIDRFGVGDVDGQVSIVEGGFVSINMAVRRIDAIRAINRGKQELSPGYRVRIDATSGVHPEFGAFDAIQRDRQYNHLAVVDSARGGPSVRLRTDGAAYQVRDSSTPSEPTMKLLTTLLAALGVSRTDSDDADITKAIAAVEKLNADADASASTADQAKADAAKAKADAAETVALADQAKADAEAATATATGERDAEKARADGTAAELQVLKDADVARADAAILTGLEEKRAEFKLDAVDGEDAATLKRRLAEHAAKSRGMPEIKADASDEYLQGLIDLGVGRADARAPYAGLGSKAKEDRQDAGNRDDPQGPKTTNSIYKQHADAAIAKARGGDK